MQARQSIDAGPASEVVSGAGLDLVEKAALLTNPASGIANDFLNHFNEIFLLVENLPVLLPEMVDELMQWKPTTYVEYFEHSNLPGRGQALADYARIDPTFRRAFDATVDKLNETALRIVTVIAQHRNADGGLEAADVSEFCAEAAQELRIALDRASNMVNSGQSDPIDSAQSVADRLLSG